MNSSPVTLSCAVVLTILTLTTATIPNVPKAVHREVYDNGRILDITHQYRPDLPAYGSKKGLGPVLRLVNDMHKNRSTNLSELKLIVHSGTHVDAPGHMYAEYFDAGYDADSLDVEVLNGPVLVVDAPRDKNITAEAMKCLNIPRGVRRVLFRTLNTDRRLMWKKEFDSSYVGFVSDGAQWLVENTDIKLVGLDYISAAAFDDLIPTHRILLKNRDIIIVEGLKLDGIQPGTYTLHCLPLRLLGADGSPTRCILIKGR